MENNILKEFQNTIERNNREHKEHKDHIQKVESFDLFNNPMIDIAKKALTPEQMEEYKKIGEYMYNDDVNKLNENGSKVSAYSDQDCLIYTCESLKSGLDPKELTRKELEILVKYYGDEWYKRFDFEKDEVPSLVKEIPKLSRQERRLADRIKRKLNKKK